MVSHTPLAARRMYALQCTFSQEEQAMLSLDMWQSRSHCVKMLGYGGPWHRICCPSRPCTIWKQIEPPPPSAVGTGGSFRHPQHSDDATKLLLPPKLHFTLEPLQSWGVNSLAAPWAHGAHTKIPEPLGTWDPSREEGRTRPARPRLMAASPQDGAPRVEAQGPAVAPVWW